MSQTKDHFYTHVNKWGNDILFRGYRLSHDGKTYSRIHKKIPYKPVMFVPAQNGTHKDIYGNALSPYEFESMKEAKAAISGKDTDFMGYQWFGMDRFEYQAISGTYRSDVPYHQPTIRVGIIDIETTCDNGFPHVDQAIESVILISLYDIQNDKIYTLGDSSHGTYTPTNPKVTYIPCADETELLTEFIAIWKKLDFDIVTGWNSQLFDLPYLYNRIWRVSGDEKMAKSISPWEIVQSRKVFSHNREHLSLNFYGIASLDYLDLYKKFTFIQQPTYKLDAIANVELGEKKISYDEYESIHTFYKSDWQKFVDYNIHDVVLVHKLEQKMKFIDLAITMCYTAKANLQDIYSQVRLWDCIIYNDLIQKNIVIPQSDYNSEKMSQYAGAYVKEPACGLHNWVMSYDLASLYPMLIRQYNISPETKKSNSKRNVDINDILEKSLDTDFLKQNNITMAASGMTYDTSKPGFLGDILMRMYIERKKYKQLMIDEERNLENIREEIERRNIAK